MTAPPPPPPSDEAARLAELRRYNILDTPPDPAFDDLARLAAQLCAAPIALVSLVDEDRLWFKSGVGLTVGEMPRDHAFCAIAIRGREPLIVPDAADDPRFAANSLVRSAPPVRFYAGAPLITPAGQALGTLCIMDLKPRELSAGQRESILALARLVVTRLELGLAGAQLGESEARFRHLFENAAVGIFRTTPDGRILAANPAMLRLLDFPSFEELAKMNLEEWGMEERYLRGEFKKRIERDGAVTNLEQTWMTRHNRVVHVRESSRVVRDRDGGVLYYEGAIEDITAQRLAESEFNAPPDGMPATAAENLKLRKAQLSRVALHDELTGLPNRLLLEQRLQQFMLPANRGGHKVGMVILDLDHFKQINEELGFKAGDRALCALADRLQKMVHRSASLYRWGGDEFALLLPDIRGVDDAVALGEALLEAAREPLEMENRPVFLTYSLGIALFPDHADTADLLLGRATAALRLAKSQGRNMVQTYPDVRVAASGGEILAMRSKLHRAIQCQEIQVHYQPLIEAKTGRVTGVEALARWQDPQDGWISPARFIPMAEDFGLINELGHQVIERALNQLRSWRAEGQELSVALNLSKRQLFSPTFVTELGHSLASRGLAPGDVILEITESIASSDVEGAPARLSAIAAAGFRLSMDDFGTGYSSLSQLHKIPVSELKIDISFIRRMHLPEGRMMVEAIIQMARSLRMNVIAEGVEDESIGRLLIELGVDSLQGFHYSRPLPGGEIAGFIERRHTDPSWPAADGSGADD